MEVSVGGQLGIAMFVIAVIVLVKFTLRRVSGGTYAHFADDI